MTARSARRRRSRTDVATRGRKPDAEDAVRGPLNEIIGRTAHCLQHRGLDRDSACRAIALILAADVKALPGSDALKQHQIKAIWTAWRKRDWKHRRPADFTRARTDRQSFEWAEPVVDLVAGTMTRGEPRTWTFVPTSRLHLRPLDPLTLLPMSNSAMARALLYARGVDAVAFPGATDLMPERIRADAPSGITFGKHYAERKLDS